MQLFTWENFILSWISFGFLPSFVRNFITERSSKSLVFIVYPHAIALAIFPLPALTSNVCGCYMSRHVPTCTCKVTPAVVMKDIGVDNLFITLRIFQAVSQYRRIHSLLVTDQSQHSEFRWKVRERGRERERERERERDDFKERWRLYCIKYTKSLEGVEWERV